MRFDLPFSAVGDHEKKGLVHGASAGGLGAGKRRSAEARVGLTGPIDGKNYQAGFMAPLSALGLTRDSEVAELARFLRFAWGHELPGVTPDEAKAIRERFKDRKTPWTEAELDD